MYKLGMVTALVALLAHSLAQSEFVVVEPPDGWSTFGIKGHWACKAETAGTFSYTLCKKK